MMLPKDEKELKAFIAECLKEYLKLIGGTLSGNVVVEANSPKYELNEKDTNAQGAVYMNGSIINLQAKNVQGDNSNWRAIRVGASNVKSDLKDAVYITERVSDVEKHYGIFGEHNKPAGSYTGNGDATARTIETGGIGNIVSLTSDYGGAILTPSGGILLNSDGISHIPYIKGHYANGVITLATSDYVINGSGVSVRYNNI